MPPEAPPAAGPTDERRAVWTMMQRRLERARRRARLEADLAAAEAATRALIINLDERDEEELAYLRGSIEMMAAQEGTKRLRFVLKDGALGRISMTRGRPKIKIVDNELAISDVNHPSGAVKPQLPKVDKRKALEWALETGEVLSGCTLELPTQDDISISFGGSDEGSGAANIADDDETEEP